MTKTEREIKAETLREVLTLMHVTHRGDICDWGDCVAAIEKKLADVERHSGLHEVSVAAESQVIKDSRTALNTAKPHEHWWTLEPLRHGEKPDGLFHCACGASKPFDLFEGDRRK